MGACDSVKSDYGGFRAFVFEVVCRCDWEEIGWGVVLMVVSKWLWVFFVFRKKVVDVWLGGGLFLSLSPAMAALVWSEQGREFEEKERERKEEKSSSRVKREKEKLD